MTAHPGRSTANRSGETTAKARSGPTTATVRAGETGAPARSAETTAPARGDGTARARGTAASDRPGGSRRVPAGAAVLREDLTGVIREAVLEELAVHGYGRLSIEGVARRAGVGKTTIYRRWDSKLEMVLDVVAAVAVQGIAPPDTGSLRGDLRAVLGAVSLALRHPLALKIVPDLLAEAARSSEIADTLQTALREAQVGFSGAVLAKAVERGEVEAGTDVQLALDLAVGPLYWRLAVVRTKLPKGYLDALTDRIVAAITSPTTG
jgi:AcrR family transcriptional regulator